MTLRNLDYIFRPRAVALIGASNRDNALGSVIARNLLAGDFGGPVLPVNPRYRAIHGCIAYPDIASLPTVPDLGVICTPPETVPGIVAQLGARGAKGAVVITAGFGEGGAPEGRALRQQVLDAARPHTLRIIGPNCLGVIVPGSGLDASFSPAVPRKGRLAFVTQSGAIVASIIDWARERQIGFSHLVSLGDMLDVDFGDMLDYLANDPGTRAILLYIEGVTHPRKFMSAARAAARMKTVIVVKAGRHAEGARAAASHTGAMAGVDKVYDAAFRRAGLLRVTSLGELFDAAEILSFARGQSGERLAILSNGGGMGVLATDALMDEGGRLATLDEDTLRRLDAVLPAAWSHGNPIDIIGDAPGSRYADALDAVLADKGVDAVLVLNCPTALASGTEAAEAIVARTGGKAGKLVLTSWVGGEMARAARAVLTRNGWPTYETPERAARAFMYLVNYGRARELLMETPPSWTEAFSPDHARARAPIERALADGREWLTEPEAKEVLEAYDIPVVPTRVAATPEEAGEAARAVGFPVALKILSPDITHKTDVGGVVLDLAGKQAVSDVAAGMLARVARARPDARIDGFIVEAMERHPDAFELIVGMHCDPQFGPVILFGQGGTATEVVGDTALGLPPLNMKLARELVSRTRIARLLEGHRGRPGADLAAIASTLMKISQLTVDFAEVVEIEINPLLADAEGVIALDARIRVAPASQTAVERLTIRPYPRELEETVTTADGRTLLIRPIVPEDEPALQAGFAKLTPEEVRLRFMVSMKELSHVQAARFTQLDYDREMALILTEPGIHGQTEIFGVVRISTDPDNEAAEYAIVIRHELTGKGLGRHLMRRIIDYARGRGIGEIFGEVLRENQAMRGLCADLGFSEAQIADEPDAVRVSLRL